MVRSPDKTMAAIRAALRQALTECKPETRATISAGIAELRTGNWRTDLLNVVDILQ